MSSFRKALTAMAGLLVLLLTTPSLFGQPTGSYWGPLNKSELYGGRGGNATQSRNIPAGTVVDPGSQVLYIVDTGVNLREEGREASGDSELDEAKWGDPLEVVRPDLYEPGIGGSTLAPGAISQTFLAITNTHPTQAITVHFRYFNDECVDLLDFLVLLTCNDTLIMDPFNFIVPETESNTRNRIFGPAKGILTPISSRQFASGRFLIFATASGTSTDSDDNAEIRYPYEFRDTYLDSSRYAHCQSLDRNQYFGSVAGIVAQNLHVFNANAVAFNYLIGAQTFAELVSEQGASPIAQAWGLNAWTRPAVDGWYDAVAEYWNTPIAVGWDLQELGLQKLDSSPNRRNSRRHPDGDGRPLLAHNDFRILMGGEVLIESNGDPDDTLNRNLLQLRAELHGGDTARLGVDTLFPCDRMAPCTPSVRAVGPTLRDLDLSPGRTRMIPIRTSVPGGEPWARRPSLVSIRKIRSSASCPSWMTTTVAEPRLVESSPTITPIT